jgi:chitin disaccharide deacetylase
VSARPRVLIVTADDFGLTAGVSRGIARAHHHGVVTSASVLAVGARFALAAEIAREQPSLHLGAHLAMVGEDAPLLTAREIPTLVDRRGRFHRSWRHVAVRSAAGLVDRDDVRREFRAQLERVQGIGRALTHLDSHQHVHLWPQIGSVLVELAHQYGIPGIRVPRSGRTLPLGAGIRRLADRLCEQALQAGLVVAEGHAGLDEAGKLDGRALTRALSVWAARDARSVEINTHPGEADDRERARFRWGYRWAAEMDLLCDPRTREQIARLGYELGSYATLAVAAGSAS